jgi:hypothetical protein
MTNSIQQNSSTAFYKIDAELSEIKRVSEENEKLLISLFDSLNNLSDELVKLDFEIKKKLVEDALNSKNKGER